MTTAQGRQDHFDGKHITLDNSMPTVEQRAAWAADCVYCARLFTADGQFVREAVTRTPSRTETSYSGGPSYSVGGPRFTPEQVERSTRTAQGGSYANGGRPTYPATEAQVRFVESLWAQKDTSAITPEVKAEALADKRLTSKLIDTLKALPAKPAAPKVSDWPAAPAPVEVTEDGMYQDPEDGTVYKVQIAKQGSRRLYAKTLVITEGDGQHHGHFEYTPGAIRKIQPSWKMTLEQAAAFGALYGICCKCGADLTDEGSIARGIGPICAQGF